MPPPLKIETNIDVSKLAKRDIRIISMKNDARPPEWFRVWSETIYENRQPKWFKDWTEKRFDPLAKDVASLKVDVADLKVRITKVETKLDTVIKLNNLRTE